MNALLYLNKLIEYSFYALFFLVPLIFWGSTSELFELNKMWLTYGLTTVILGCWMIDAIIKKRFFVKKTPLDIPIILFLISQTISTFISLDSYVSFYGYYSRFNGGLLSTLCFISLYYAFITYFDLKKTIRLIKVILISGLGVVLWGLPSHFGYDPTCYIFRGELNVSCWTEAFKPTIRMFSTLGQPAWLAAYLSVLLPISTSMFIKFFATENAFKIKNQAVSSIFQIFKKNFLLIAFYFVLTAAFYLSLLYTGTRAGFLGFWIGNVIFWILILLKRIFTLKHFILLFILLNLTFFIINFFVGTPLQQLNKLTFNYIFSARSELKAENTNIKNITARTTDNTITDSADIRQIVWKGAIDAWKSYPVIGSGVETFAFAYYRFRPAEHNLTSEWDYLYNKAHNEFLNYLTTTGIFGLGSYLLIIGVIVLYFIKLFTNHKISSLKYTNLKMNQPNNQNQALDIQLVTFGLFTGWISILITNFFGFSVVIVNLLFFLIPALILILNNTAKNNKFYSYPKKLDSEDISNTQSIQPVNVSQWIFISVLLLVSCYLLLVLFRHWQADRSYALGVNLSRSNYPQEAFNLLSDAVSIRPNEPVFKDELSMSALQISLLLFQQNEATTAAKFAQTAIDLNDNILINHPNYLPFWKSRIRLYNALGELVPEYKKEALKAAMKTESLAPTDVKILYNLGILYGQTGQEDEAIRILNKTIRMKPDYQDAYFALALLYNQIATDSNGLVINRNSQSKAIEILNYLIKKYPDNTQAKNKMTEWKK